MIAGRGHFDCRSLHLGFKNQGLLLVLPETCPNNSLPILYKAKVGVWTPLFPRPTT
ncbi:hypothetical protein PCPL58_p5051 (plasmid) [Pseudomonas cerasi]|nr:hypothetical protein PCPL58_p5051 [Pseudomonas cerasi]